MNELNESIFEVEVQSPHDGVWRKWAARQMTLADARRWIRNAGMVRATRIVRIQREVVETFPAREGS